MTVSLTRRRLLAAGCGAMAAPRASAQAAPRRKVVGLMTAGQGAKFLAPALAKHGWIEGRDVRYEVRQATYAMAAPALDAAAADLVRAGPDVIITTGAPFVMAMHRATRTIPIVCGGIHDPIDAGLARSLQQPGMNVTGLSFGLREAAVLQLGTLRALAPGLRKLVFLTVETDDTDRVAPSHAAAAERFKMTTELRKVAAPDAVEKTLATLQATDGVWLAQAPAGSSIEAIASEATTRRIPVHAMNSRQVRSGLLLSYWIAHADALGRVAALTDKVLRGVAPGTIPFELPDKTEFAFNRATARAIGLRVPDDILVRATEVFG